MSNTSVSGDDVIRLAKQLAFMLEAVADEAGFDVNGTEANFSSEGTPLLSVNAGDLVKRAKALTYGCIEEDE